jgi:hypothetical protein
MATSGSGGGHQRGQHMYAYSTVRKKIKKKKKEKETSYLVVSGAQASSTGAAGIVPIVVASCPWRAGGEGEARREGGKEGKGENVEGEERTQGIVERVCNSNELKHWHKFHMPHAGAS